MIDIIGKVIILSCGFTYAFLLLYVVFDFIDEMISTYLNSKINSKKRNKVHFYVARDKNGSLWLYIAKPVRRDTYFYGYTLSFNFKKVGLNTDDFKDLKWEDEPVEVFLNMKD